MRELSVDDVLDVLEGLFGLSRARSQMLARLKHMHRLDFPTGHATGRGYRSTYDAGKLIQIALAFALIDAGLAPSDAVGIIGANRAAIGEGVLTAMRGSECRLVTGAGALSGMGGRPGASKSRRPTAMLVREERASPVDQQPMATVVLALGSFMRQLERQVLMRPGLAAYDWTAAVQRDLSPAS